MANPSSTTISAAGIVSLVSPDPHDAGPDGWMLRFRPVAFGGTLVLYQNQNAPGSVASLTTSNLTAVPWTLFSTLVQNAARTPIGFTTSDSAPLTIVVGTASIFGLYASVAWVTGRLECSVAPYTARDTKAETALFSGLTFDSVPPTMDDTWEIVPAVEDAASSG